MESVRAWDVQSQRAMETELDGESECTKAIAEAERVLRELSLDALTPHSNPRRSTSIAKRPTAQSAVSAPSETRPPALLPLSRLCLDLNLDFVVHEDGVIELTEAGFRRIVQTHSAGLEAAIWMDGREVLRLPAPKVGHDPDLASGRRALQSPPRCTDLIESHVRRTQPISELLKAEESSEVAMDLINKERERHEIESLLPWHAAGTLDRRDLERVERALAEDGELAQRYELVREELAETIRLNEGLGAPSARAMDKLFAAIDAEERRAPRRPLQHLGGTPVVTTVSP
jgi:hypothetical protein